MTQVESDKAPKSHSHVKEGLIDLAGGTVGGIANVYAAQPLDTIKVKMQAFPNLYRSALLCFKETLRLDGIRGLYAGTTPALVANIVENSVLFAAYGYCQKTVAFVTGHSDVQKMSPAENAMSGSLAAFIVALFLCPTELVKCRLQAQREVNPNVRITPWSVCRDMYRTQGLRSFCVGMTATLVRDVPGFFFFFGAYELSRYFFSTLNKSKDEIGPLRTAVSGGIGGMALWTSTYPADVVKSRMQITGTGRFGKMLIHILKNEGVRALYKGLPPTLVRTFVASGALFVTFENSKKLLTWLLA